MQEIFSVGGSLGPVRVAAGVWDASIEIDKGFRPWDFLPGAFIAQGAGAAVLDMEGNDLDVTLIPDVEELIRNNFDNESREKCRTKFVVAATKGLAEQIVELIDPDG